MEHDIRKRINILLNDAERKTVEDKMHQYGYNSMAAYIRDAAISEKITVYSLEGKTEVGIQLSELANGIGIYTSDLDLLLLRKDLSADDIAVIQQQNRDLHQSLEELKQLVEDKLWSVERVKKVLGEGKLF